MMGIDCNMKIEVFAKDSRISEVDESDVGGTFGNAEDSTDK